MPGFNVRVVENIEQNFVNNVREYYIYHAHRSYNKKKYENINRMGHFHLNIVEVAGCSFGQFP